MEFKKDNSGSYVFPHERDDLTVRVRPTANAWWKDPFKVYLLLETIDNQCSPIDEACHIAGITRRQYKYFAQEHPVVHERKRLAKFIKKEKELIQKHKQLVDTLMQGDSVNAAIEYLRYFNPEEFDLRYRSPLARLRRLHGLPATPPPLRSEAQKLYDMKVAVEKTRAMYARHSKETHPEMSDLSEGVDMEIIAPYFS
jgi:hypothetical protein